MTMADVQTEPAGPAVVGATSPTEAERRSVRHTLSLIEAALADCPADLAPASTEVGGA
jgi:hypothetical protein